MAKKGIKVVECHGEGGEKRKDEGTYGDRLTLDQEVSLHVGNLIVGRRGC